jgi:hypothetical protein
MKRIINVETGEVIERELNAEELAQQEIDEAEYLEGKQFLIAEAEAKAEAKEAAQAKLEALGLTAEDLIALGLIKPINDNIVSL